MERLPLRFVDGSILKIREERFQQTKDELDEFLATEKHLHTKTFAKDVMFSHELKANNQIEGYSDDVNLIKGIIKKRYGLKSEQAKRILNLYHGYNYILREPNINPDTLKHLYDVLSKDLLCSQDKNRMGEYYRNDKVYILLGGKLSYDLDEGIEAELIDNFMNAYFDFLNNYNCGEGITNEYIKSQILHFYFVYIHPYFDVNGRTSRTVAMWYLLNKKAYPYIIFNRGITFRGNDYDRAIIDVKKFHDISFFIDYMLKTVQIELEKEYIMQNIQNATSKNLDAVDFQTLLYILSMNGLITVNDYVAMYNRHHDKRRAKEIYENMIDPLKQKNVLQVVRTTKGFIYNDIPNEVIEINPSMLDYDKDKIKRLTLYK